MSDDASGAASPAPFPWVQVGLLALSHMLADGFVTFHHVLTPLLAEKLSFTVRQAGVAIMCLSATANFGQPICGYLNDRRRQRPLLLVGLGLAMVSASFLGMAPTYGGFIAILLCSGAGLALYHPAAAALASAGSPATRSRMVSLWSAGGSLGVMLGPYFVGLVVGETAKVYRSLWALVPGALLFAPLTLWVAERASDGRGRSHGDGRTDQVGAFAHLLFQGVLRSMCVGAFLVFLPFYLRRQLDMTPDWIGLAVGVFGLCGVAGVMAGGWLADRWSRRGVMVFPILAASVVLVSAVLWPVPFWLLLALLGAGGALAWAGHAVNIVLGYEYVPSRPALASGLMVGGAWGVATLSFPFWGSLADAHGPNMALIGLLATTPVLAAVAALVLPHTERPGEARP